MYLLQNIFEAGDCVQAGMGQFLGEGQYDEGLVLHGRVTAPFGRGIKAEPLIEQLHGSSGCTTTAGKG